jgi:hypothetical protein
MVEIEVWEDSALCQNCNLYIRRILITNSRIFVTTCQKSNRILHHIFFEIFRHSSEKQLQR